MARVNRGIYTMYLFSQLPGYDTLVELQIANAQPPNAPDQCFNYIFDHQVPLRLRPFLSNPLLMYREKL